MKEAKLENCEEMSGEKNSAVSNALLWAIATGAGLALIKFATGLLTHSMAIIASALDSTMDVAVSIVNFIAAKEAAKPPDDEHAYGHEKIESLAGLFQSTLIGFSGLYIIFESIRRLIFGSFVRDVGVGMGVMAFSIAASWLLVWRLQVVFKKNKSLILATERLHFTTDILTNGGIVLALLLVGTTRFVFWDLIVSIFVAVYIFKTSYQIWRRSVNELLDRGLPLQHKEQLEELIRNHHPAIVGLHNFRTRSAGEKLFLDFHIEIRGEDNFKKAHLITESLIQQIRERYPGADVTVHFDPEGEM